MFRKISFFALFMGLFVSTTFAQNPIPSNDPLDNMPILKETNPATVAGVINAPIEQRSQEFRKFLASSVKITVPPYSGSGTIVYYDGSKNIAYVASCGHLWSPGTMSSEEGKKKKLTCKIIVWYHNDEKLKTPHTYDASVIFYSYLDGQDTSLLTFSPDWIPEYFPIGPDNYQYTTGKHAHSCGCDGGKEVAHYDVEMLGLKGDNLLTLQNSPRPGRSGGGLMDDNGYYIGTCWGTEFKQGFSLGSGKGFFTPLPIIHRYWGQQKEYTFLLNQKPEGIIARQIPILDRNNNQGKYDPSYILLPNSK